MAIDEHPTLAFSAIQVLREFLSQDAEPKERSAVVTAIREMATEPKRCGIDKFRGFDLFWDLYPKRHGRKVGKSACREKWGRMKLDEKRAAYRGLKNYVEYCRATQTPPRDPCRFLAAQFYADFLDDGDPIAPTRPSYVPAHAVPDGNGGWQI